MLWAVSHFREILEAVSIKVPLCLEYKDNCAIPPKACDPWAVRSAQTYLRGKDRLAGLTDFQKQIVQFIQKRGEATAEEIAMAFGVSQQQLIRDFATLRHMEILGGFRKEGKICYTLFERIAWKGGG